MATASEEILSRQARHMVGLARRQTAVERSAVEDHDEITDELLAVLATLGAGLSRRIVSHVIVEVQRANRDLSDAAIRRLEEVLSADLLHELLFQERIALESAPTREWSLPDPSAIAALTEGALATGGLVFAGKKLRDWLRAHEAKRIREVETVVERMLATEGARLDDLVGEVSAALAGMRHEIAAVAGGGHSAAAAAGADLWWGNNVDEIRAWRWSSVVDTRVTPHICLPRDGKLYSAEDRDPIDHNLPWGLGPGRIHFRCRSLAVPILTGEAIPERFTVQDWLRSRPLADVERVFGKRRAQLWLSGQISAEDMVRPDGRQFTLTELQIFDAADGVAAGG